MFILQYLQSLVTGLSQADLLVIAGALAVGVQYAANHYKPLGNTLNWVLSFPLPSFTAVLTFLAAQSHFNFVKGGLAYLVAQVLYFTVEKVKEAGAKSVTVAPAAEATF